MSLSALHQRDANADKPAADKAASVSMMEKDSTAHTITKEGILNAEVWTMTRVINTAYVVI